VRKSGNGKRSPKDVQDRGSSFKSGMEAFCERHRDWNDRFKTDDPVYAIPRPACSKFVLGELFPKAVVAAEMEFAEVCWRHGHIGVLKARPVTVPPLHRVPLGLNHFSEDDWRFAFGKDPPSEAMLQRVDAKLVVSNDRLLGIIGFLATEPAFLEEFAELRKFFGQVPERYRSDLPQGVPRSHHPLGIPLGSHYGSPEQIASILQRQDPSEIGRRIEVDRDLERYQIRLDAFMRKWCLTRIVTWDWVMPQGPFISDPLPNDAVARPSHGVLIMLPSAYPLKGDDDLQGQIRRFQMQQAEVQGIPKELVALEHHELYAQFAKLIHLDTVLRSRFSDRPPRGYITHLAALSADFLGVSSETTSNYWKWIRSCRKGGRSSIPKLRINS
jgi:hypothetical protein